ncbi:MAG: Endoribonuclease Nob1 [Promethearchaeota archaeon]|nr:MAG: Endoribonuclease Nob1 [Candidatus Lokiarchaeota archaeon]
MKHNKDRILKVFDANIFLSGLNFNLIKGLIYTTPNVINEIDVKQYKDKNRNILTRIDAALESNQLIVQTPEEHFIKKVEMVSKKTGDFRALSETDKHVLALALELKETKNQEIIIYTDDYSMENVALELEIHYSQFFRDGIKKKVQWEVYCPTCNIVYKPEDLFEKCELCETRLKRRPTKKKGYRNK